MKTNQPITLAIASNLDVPNSRISRTLNRAPHSQFLIPVNHQVENPIAKLWSLLKTLRLV